MKASTHKPLSIISANWQHLLLIIILAAGAWVRLNRIAFRTEFLGDQGRAGLVAMDISQGKFPQLGPTVLSGQYLGPAFYYLVGVPFIAGGFDPLWPAVATALLGVFSIYLLWYVAASITGPTPALFVAALWALSPHIIVADQIIWEPNIIPFFVFGWIACLVHLFKRSHWVFALFAGASVGILLQLHYPNGIFLVLSVVAAIALWISAKSRADKRLTIHYYIAFTLALLGTLAPFLWHEIAHGFENTLGVVSVFSQTGGSVPLGKRVILAQGLDYTGRVFGRMIPLTTIWQSAVALAATAVIILVSRNIWAILVGMWLAVGLGAFALYRGVVFDHYLMFLFPAPFIVLAMLLKRVERSRLLRVVGFVGITLILLFRVAAVTRPQAEVADIPRLTQMTREVLVLAGGEPFAFALISSRSFSDLHWRYFFRRKGVSLLSVEDPAAQQLVIACEKLPCPSFEELVKAGSLQVICNEAHCSGQYPKVVISEWKLLSEWEGEGGMILLLRRAQD